jgi:hypothetical protein
VGENSCIVVQLLNLTCLPNKNRITCSASDGYYSIKSFIETKKVENPCTYQAYLEILKNSIVKIKSHLLLANVGVSLENFEVLGHYSGLIG